MLLLSKNKNIEIWFPNAMQVKSIKMLSVIVFFNDVLIQRKTKGDIRFSRSLDTIE